MKFCDNLQKLRKEHHLSQEQLAEKLNVSRQAVSKWESGAAYPEMDKIIAMTKIFDCTLDMLVNEDIKERKKENNNKKVITDYKDDILNFVNKTVDMFSKMPVKEILRCIIILIIVSAILSLGKIPVEYISQLGTNFFNVFPNPLSRFLVNSWEVILDIAYFLIAIIIFIYIFKIKFLDNYEISEAKNRIKKEKLEANSSENSKEEVKDNKIKVQTNNSEYHSMTFLEFLSKLIIYFIKFMAIIIIFPLIFSLLFLIVCLALSVILLFQKVYYIGILLSLIAVVVLNVTFLEILFNFIFNVKNKTKKIFINIILSIIILGIGIGVTSFDIANSTVINKVPENINLEVKNYEYNMTNDLILDFHYSNIKYIEDEALADKVLVKLEYYDKLGNYDLTNIDNRIILNFESNEISFKDIYKILIKDLQTKTFHNYNKLNDSNIIITSSKANIAKLIDNTQQYNQKMYEEETDNYIDELYEKIDQTNIELEELQEKYEELEEQKEEQKIEYQEQIEEYKDKIQEYKDAINSIE